jgi:hypothetical protein
MLSLQHAMEAHKVVRRRDFHIFWIMVSQMALRLSALTRRPHITPGIFLLLISVRVLFDPRTIMQLEGLD